MIRSRQEILNLNSCYAEHLLSTQKSKYAPLDRWTEGDSVILNASDEATVLTKELADKLNEKEHRYYLEHKDYFELPYSNKWQGRTTLISSKLTPADYLNEIGHALAQLSIKFGNLIIMGDWSTPWLSQHNDYPPVQKAIEYLSRQINDKFNGGFDLKAHEISDFILHLFWLIRCNASLPEIMMTFESSKTIFGFCKYGVLHLEFYNRKEREELLKQFIALKFKEVERCSDPVRFDNMNGIKIIISN